LLIAGTSTNLGVIYDCIFLLSNIHIGVKNITTSGQSAEVRSKYTCSDASQRLNAGDLSSLYSRSLVRPYVYFHSNRRVVPVSYVIIKSCFLTKAAFSLPSSYVSGLSDGESCFVLSFIKNSNYKSGYQVKAVYSVQLHIKDLVLLKKIQAFFGVGTITIKKGIIAGSAIYSIQSYKELIFFLIPHFDKYPLLTQKKADYLLFKSAVYLMNEGEHLTDEGLRKLVSIRASMNNGLTEVLKTLFPDIIPVKRPIVQNSSILISDPH
jgi:hypothetical protein